MVEKIASNNDEGMRLSRFVEKNTVRLPRSLLHKSFRNKRIKINGKRAEADYRLLPGDRVQMYLNDEFFENNPAESPACSSPPISKDSWSVVFENPQAAVLYKAGGVLSHSDSSGQGNLLDNYIQSLVQRGEFIPAQSNGFSPALCNRLDRGTEGLLLCAKTYPALHGMNQLIREGKLSKEYLCITTADPPQGEHHGFLLRNRETRTVQVAQEAFDKAKPIHTEVEILDKFGGLTLCRILLHTGRTHQIRAHLSYLGAPLLGDQKYQGVSGDTALLPGYSKGQLALCAYRLSFTGTLPENLEFLSKKTFTAEKAELPRIWENFKHKKNTF